jgi:hypothetical protein
MKRLSIITALFALLLPAMFSRAEDWKPAAGPLMTRWAKDVSPTNAHPEYPRPQMVRKEWQNLNGLWDYAIQPAETTAPEAYQGKILVPFPIESALSGVMKRVTPKQRLWYHRTFQVPDGWKGKRVLLHFQAVDWEATVMVNGKELGMHRGGYDAFSFDVTDALKPSGDQELVVKVFDPTNEGSQPRGKQVNNPGGIFYTPCTGIWQTVWMEPAPTARIDRLILTPDIDAGQVKVAVKWQSAAGVGGEGTIEAVALDGDKEIARGTAAWDGEVALKVPNAKLWTPEQPTLYDLRVKLTGGDQVESYFAMRKTGLGKDADGVLRLQLNNKFVFQVGPLDQGFWPDGIYTAPTDEALRYDIEMTKKLGMNMARKHVKIEPDRWYYWCDKLGLLVWQDMPSGDNRTPEAKKQFEKELVAMIEGLRNHPSIIMWVVFNEGWGQHDTPRYCDLVKKLDPSRLVNNASGWTDQKCGDVIDIHSYPGPGAPTPEANRAGVLGEFGGLGLPVSGHTWLEGSSKNWGYKSTGGFDDLTRNYCKLLQRAWGLKDTKGLSACVYTQTTDCETECNGLMTYDRAVVKVGLEKAAAANRGELKPPKVTVVVPPSLLQGQTWRYSLEKPADGWTKADFDDASWKEGPGGFGTKATPGAVVRTPWSTKDIWLRRTFDLPDAKTDNLAFLVHHDEDVEIYVNGVLAAKAGGFVTEYEDLSLTPEGRAALKPGKNTLAVHCRQTQGGQYVDVGLVKVDGQ